MISTTFTNRSVEVILQISPPGPVRRMLMKIHHQRSFNTTIQRSQVHQNQS